MVNKMNRRVTIKNVPLGKMAVSDQAQRRCNDARVDYLVSQFDPEQIGHPVVSERNGHFYLIDGQHRIRALKLWLGDGWEVQTIPCAVYNDLTEADEAEMFLRQNDVLIVSSFDKFKTAVAAGRSDETEIKGVVEKQGLKISRENVPGGISAVGTLRKVFKNSDGATLGRSLRIIRDAFGDAGFEAVVIEGMGHLCKRYNGQLDEQVAKKKLGAMRGGVKGLVNRAEELRLRTGNQRSHCIAAAAVDIINQGAGPRSHSRLPSWWKE